MDKVIEKLLADGGLIQVVIFFVPGFISWKTLQLRTPSGEQQAAEVLFEIFVASVATALIWTRVHWANWPDTLSGVILLAIEIFVTPIVFALCLEYVLTELAKRNLITSSHPRAWDYFFNSLALRSATGSFLIVTTKNSGKIAGAYVEPAYASLWPYDRDLFIGELWQLNDGDQPSKRVEGSIGLYLSADNIDTIEVLDYVQVKEAAASRHPELTQGVS
jgi:hypothetical protein